ncbi:MAG: large conductance mechanosensitive channel protein MscL [Verrucomicrobia bacterium]|nr:large conductance mechanosensitive channel protein MscL [Verrucomicrobiota bacterium]
MDLGVIIGTAFGKIVTSIVNNVFMPVIGLLVGRIDFSNLYIALNGQHYAGLKEATDRGASVLAYGLFINSVVEFLIIAFVLFLVIRPINRFKTPTVVEVVPSTQEKLLTEIRDVLKSARQGL